MKKFASLLLTAVLLATMLSVFAVPASAAEFTSDDYKYTVNGDGTATITQYTGNGGNVEIPAAFDGHTVTAIGVGAFANCGQLTAVTIPGSVVSIGLSAFANCGGIKTLTISDGVKSIGTEAFSGCDKIASVTIPGSVVSIGGHAFANCGQLTAVTIPGSVVSIGEDAFADGNSNLVINGPYGSAADQYALENGVTFKGEGTCSHLYCFVCDSCHKSLTKSDLLQMWNSNGATASTLSEGSLAIITAVAGIAVGMTAMFFIMKKKKPALASGEETDEE